MTMVTDDKLTKVTELHEGDCLVESERIDDGSVSLILTDPPYGTMDGIEMDSGYFEIARKRVQEAQKKAGVCA